MKLPQQKLKWNGKQFQNFDIWIFEIVDQQVENYAFEWKAFD